MENQNNRQRDNNQDNGVMDKIGQAIENVMDTVTGDNNQNNGNQQGRKNNNNR
nr:hypothetical protein [Neobacillus sp. Marseille-Q6967]